MTQKKKKKPVRPAESTAKKTAAPSQPPVAEKMAPKSKGLLIIAAVVMVSAMAAMFYSSSGRIEYGTGIYMRFQQATYLLTGFSGAIVAYSTKFNETKRKLNIQVMGLVLMMLGLGNFIGLLMM